MSQMLRIADLKPHKKNSVFFDDIEGDAWSEFLESIRTSGVIEPIIVTQDNVIVSGHQRVRACKALRIEEINAEVRQYDSEDEILKQLIETNIRQRGIGNANPVKFGRCLMELERIYGIQQGNNQHSRTPNNSESSKSQNDLASELGLSVDTIANYKKLAQAIPEVQSLVESGKVTKTVALGLMKRLTEDEQKELVGMLPKDVEKISPYQVRFYEERIKKLNEEKEKLNNTISEMKRSERNQKPAPVEVDDISDDRDELLEQIEGLQSEIDEMRKQEAKVPIGNYVGYFCSMVDGFTTGISDINWINESIDEMSDADFELYCKAIKNAMSQLKEFNDAVSKRTKKRT